MNDYMTALLERFQIETPELSAYQARTAAAETKLKETLDAEQRKLLLQLTDCQNTYRQEAALSGFLSGWRLASGIRDELDAFTFFDFNKELTKKFNELFWSCSAYKIDGVMTGVRDVNIPVFIRVTNNGKTYTYKDMIDNMQKSMTNNDFNICSITTKTWGKIAPTVGGE